MIKKMIYYGFMVSEFDGDVTELNPVNCDFKPSHETCGFAYAKWFINKDKMIKCMNYTIKTIKKMR